MPEPADESVLLLQDLCKDYGAGPTTLHILKDLNLDVRRGEMVAIVGASGSGKTTLLNILGCLDRPTSGYYRLHGNDVSRYTDDQLSRIRNRDVGFVFQSFNLIPQLTVLENVEVPLFYSQVTHRERKERSLALIESVGLSHRVDAKPPTLSGGEQQRVAIARALVNEPVLVLADEPTGNLDSKSGEDVLRILDDLHAQGRTIVMVTHNPEIAGALPRCVEMKDGRFSERGQPAGAVQ
jgi:putative ABC transport system ATP-binding protein